MPAKWQIFRANDGNVVAYIAANMADIKAMRTIEAMKASSKQCVLIANAKTRNQAESICLDLIDPKSLR